MTTPYPKTISTLVPIDTVRVKQVYSGKTGLEAISTLGIQLTATAGCISLFLLAARKFFGVERDVKNNTICE